MNKTFYHKNLTKKILVYTSAAMLFATTPTLPAFAAETNSQTPDAPAETPTQQASQPISNTTTDSTPVPGTTAAQTPTDTVPAPTTPQSPTDTITVTPQTPTDATTVTPQPAPTPADQGTSDVTPMQSTVYAASPKGLNVRTGPSTDYPKLGKPLQYGQEITVTGSTSNNWYQIQYSGSVGYVRADLVSSTPLNTQTPAPETPDTTVSEPPATENPDANAVETPPADIPVNEPVNEVQTEDNSSEEGITEVTSQLLGTPVMVVLAIAIVGVIALIGYSVYSLFKKETNNGEAYYEDEYYEDGQYSDDEYDEYDEEEPYSDDEYYEEEPYSDDEYYGEEPYSDSECDEEEPYSDDEYYEDNEQYFEYEYYEDNDKK